MRGNRNWNKPFNSLPPFASLLGLIHGLENKKMLTFWWMSYYVICKRVTLLVNAFNAPFKCMWYMSTQNLFRKLKFKRFTIILNQLDIGGEVTLFIA